MRQSIVFLAGVLLATTASAGGCGTDPEVVTGPGGEVTVPEPGAGGEGVGADLVISVERGGGFVAPGADFRTPPAAAIYEDGTALSPAATTAVFPGPAVAPLVTGTLAEGELEQLVAAAAGAGLLDETPPDVGEPPVADAATTTIRVVAEGTEHVVDVYALGINGGPGPEPLPGLTPDQVAARQRIGEVVDQVTAAAMAAGEASWEPDRYRVLPLDPALGGDPAVEPGRAEWPFPEVVLEEGQCLAVAGEEAERLGEALAQATEITRWTTAGGREFLLAVRAVLPHEPGCPS
ncbi:MAG TPA: hypothetical protein VNT56_02785 [Acidimicrobiales bacterium]|nr:hypothetical protein [Acidimicrobiales bacterium]